MSKLHILCLVFLCSICTAGAQTPIANRVQAMARSLAPHAKIVAKYTDNQRHCLYYTYADRLYSFDVITNRHNDISFATDAYANIISSWLSPDGNFIFIAVDRGNYANFYLEDGKELWRYDTREKTAVKIGSGFYIWHKPGCLIICRASRCLNPEAPRSHQQWMAQDHYYDLYGKIIWAKGEYRVKK